jgi:sensor histidine kinase regulating citrate/malate metabolism
MTEGAQAQYLVMEDRTNTALILARSFAIDQDMTSLVETDEYYTLLEQTEDQLLSSNIDILRVFDASGQVLVSASDERERNQSFSDDEMLSKVLEKKQPIKSFDREAHVLSPVMIGRGIYPILSDDEVVGAIEIGFKLDTAFVDFSKDRTGLDVTIYTDANRSATTIYKLDGVSRWVGTDETNDEVIDKVLTKGQTYALEVDRLGQDYYSAFVPIRNFKGDIIGMVSVGSPTYELFEESRQQLLSAFLILTMISIFAALLGYYAMQNLEPVKTRV